MSMIQKKRNIYKGLSFQNERTGEMEESQINGCI